MGVNRKIKQDFISEILTAYSNGGLGYDSLTVLGRCKIYDDNKFVSVIMSNFSKCADHNLWLNDEEGLYFSSDGYIDTRVKRSRMETQDLKGYKKLMQSINAIVIYRVEEPTFEPFSEEIQEQLKSLKTYYPVTNIIINDEDAEMSVTYVADTQTYIDNKFKELSNAIVATAE